METINFNLFYKQNYNKVYNYCIYRLKNIVVCEEIANDVFSKFQRHLRDEIYNPDKSTIKTYLFTIVNCAIIDYLRSSSKDLKIINPDDYLNTDVRSYYEYQDMSLNAAQKLIDFEFNNKVEKAFNKLNKLQQRVAELYFINELKYNEIAEICNISLNNVKVTIFRAREVLQKELIKVKKEYYG